LAGVRNLIEKGIWKSIIRCNLQVKFELPDPKQEQFIHEPYKIQNKPSGAAPVK